MAPTIDSFLKKLMEAVNAFSFAPKGELNMFKEFSAPDIFLKNWVRNFVSDDAEAAIVMERLKNNPYVKEAIISQARQFFSSIVFPKDPLDFFSDSATVLRNLSEDSSRALKELETISRFMVKYLISWGDYALNEDMWKTIGYDGPRSKPFIPPDIIVSENIAMTTAMYSKRPTIEYNRFVNDAYEKQMEATNNLLRENIKDISSYPAGYKPDVVIIGTGPGGAAAAYALSMKAKNKKIVVLERGDLHTSDNFNQKERDMLPALYQKPGVRFSDDFGVAVIQGNLVGGSATLNHAVCYQVPKEVTSGWDHDISVDLENYYEKVREMIHYKKVADFALNKNAQVFLKGLDDGRKHHFSPNERNTKARVLPDGEPGNPYHELTCTGCGCCVLGCRYNRKQTPLITFIPALIRNNSKNGNEINVFKNARVSAVLHEEGKVKGVRVETGFGKPDLDISAGKVIVSCGAINSARLLVNSGVENQFLGKNISLHPSPLIYAVFNEPVYSDWGIPMAGSYHEYQFVKEADGFPAGERFGYVLETIYNHPAATALTFPLKTMKRRMQDYERIANVAVILHDSPVGELTAREGLFTCIKYRLHENDKKKLRHAIRTAADIYLKAGAMEVFTNHENELVFESEEDLSKADSCSLEPGDILLASAHPQGGCKMGKPKNGVVDFNGESQNISGLFVSDASLYPTSLGVNPQLTTMAMGMKIGEYVAGRI